MGNREEIEKAFEFLRWCLFFRGGNLLLCGNGGSAADCEHIAAELVPKGMDGDGPYNFGLPAISLCSQVSAITAISNDFGADYIFAQQVFAYGDKGDVLLAITTSGKSENVLEATAIAKKRNMSVIALTGAAEMEGCDVVINCPGREAAEIQEQHIKVYHELCRRVEEEFNG